jgi:hypothetical protein
MSGVLNIPLRDTAGFTVEPANKAGWKLIYDLVIGINTNVTKIHSWNLLCKNALTAPQRVKKRVPCANWDEPGFTDDARHRPATASLKSLRVPY